RQIDGLDHYSASFMYLFSHILRPPPRSPLFPYTTLFRSNRFVIAFPLSFGFPAYTSIDAWAGSLIWSIIDKATGPLLRPSSSFRSEEHTSELQSRFDLVCRLLLEKKNAVTVLDHTLRQLD